MMNLAFYLFYQPETVVRYLNIFLEAVRNAIQNCVETHADGALIQQRLVDRMFAYLASCTPELFVLIRFYLTKERQRIWFRFLFLHYTEENFAMNFRIRKPRKRKWEREADDIFDDMSFFSD